MHLGTPQDPLDPIGSHCRHWQCLLAGREGKSADVVEGALSANRAIKAIIESGQALTVESVQLINKSALPSVTDVPDNNTLRHGWGLVRKTLKGKMFFDKTAHQMPSNSTMALDLNLLDDIERLENEQNK